MKYGALTMWFEQLNYPEVVRFLEDEVGLVPPNHAVFPNDAGPFPHKLVWEDDSGVGMYRVDYLEPRHALLFRYWGEDRVTPEIKEQDPMLDAIRKVYDSFKPHRCTEGGGALIGSQIEGRP